METSNGAQPTLDGTPKRAVANEAQQSNSASKATGPSDTSNSGEASHNERAVNTSVPTVTPLAKRTPSVVQTNLPGRVVAETTTFTLPTVQGDQQAEGIHAEFRKVKVSTINSLLFISTDGNGQTRIADANCARPSKEKIMGIMTYLCGKQDDRDIRATENSMVAMFLSQKAEKKDIEEKVRVAHIFPAVNITPRGVKFVRFASLIYCFHSLFPLFTFHLSLLPPSPSTIHPLEHLIPTQHNTINKLRALQH